MFLESLYRFKVNDKHLNLFKSKKWIRNYNGIEIYIGNEKEVVLIRCDRCNNTFTGTAHCFFDKDRHLCRKCFKKKDIVSKFCLHCGREFFAKTKWEQDKRVFCGTKCSCQHLANKKIGTHLSEETKDKISKIHIGNTYCLGKHHSIETRIKISASHKGRRLSLNHIEKIRKCNIGRKQSIETIEKRRRANIGRKCSDLTKEKIRLAHIGKKPSLETINKLSLSHVGHRPSEKTKMKMSVAHRGEKSSFWRGGISLEKYGGEFNKLLKDKIRKRDNYTCGACGKTGDALGYALSVHHVDYNKKNNSERNLISLCKLCHSKTNFNRDFWSKRFSEGMASNVA